MAFVVATLPSYIAHSLGGGFLNDDARQWTWPFWTFVDRAQYPSDFFSEYILAQTPWGFAWFAKSLISVGGTPDVIFPTFGVIAFLACALLAFLTGRMIGGSSVGWAALLLVFVIGEIASTTAGGLPRAGGLAVLSLAVFGFVASRSPATAVASILGALVWYPAAVISGLLYALQILGPKQLSGGTVAQPLYLRMALVALIGALTLLPMVHTLTNARYGELIAADDPNWPEAGPGGRFANNGMLGIVHAEKIAFSAAATLFNNPQGAWLPPTAFWKRVAFFVSFGALMATWLVLSLLSTRDPVASRLLALFLVGGVLYVLAILVAPYMFAPDRYLRLWLPTVAIAMPYAAYQSKDSLPTIFAKWLPPKPATLIISMVALTLFGAGRLTTQGLEVRPDTNEKQLMEFVAQTPPGSVFAGWPTGVINDLPCFARRPILLTYELHLPFHVKVALETRERAYRLIDAWFSKTASKIMLLNQRYGVNYLIVDRHLSPRYFKPFDERIRIAHHLLGTGTPYIDQPDPRIIVFENSEYQVLSLQKLARLKG